MRTNHPLAAQDTSPIAAMRAATTAHKGDIIGPDARPMFDTMQAATPAAAGVSFAPGTVGGIAGWWCRPAYPRPGARLLFVHGGGYVVGSAGPMRHFASHFAVRSGAETFVPDYRLAPENRFPAAIDDVIAVYRALADDAGAVALAGDSAGGGLTLSAVAAIAEMGDAIRQPVGAAVMSPWTDLALTGDSMKTRADADPIFTRDVLAALADSYLQGHDARDPKASPLYGSMPSSLPPISIHVGDDEVLLDDSLRYADRAAAAGIAVTVDVWMGMPHVFQSSLAQLSAATQSIAAIGAFLADRFDAGRQI